MPDPKKYPVPMVHPTPINESCHHASFFSFVVAVLPVLQGFFPKETFPPLTGVFFGINRMNMYALQGFL
jgi:hypothetical protein